MKKALFTLTTLCTFLGFGAPAFTPQANAAVSADWPQWRGPNRDGHSLEKGLQKQWPEGGPRLLWQQNEIGSGYSTPSVVGNTLYLLSNAGLDDEFVAAHRVEDGRRIWKTSIGKVGNPRQNPSFPGARSTPTLEGDLLYALGSDGDLVCLEKASGKRVWQRQLRTDFGGRPGEWAYSESPLIAGDKLICAPGGPQASVVALNRRNGEVIWKTAVPGIEQAAFSSAILIEQEGVRQSVHLLQKGLVGLNAATGEQLWHYPRPVSQYGANIPTPVASQGRIYAAAAGTGGGAVRILRKNGRFEVEELFFEAKMPAAIGGSIIVGDSLFGTTGQAMLCVDFETGKIRWEERALGAASMCYADGRLYLHGENGVVALVEPSSEAYQEKGRFSPPGRPSRISPMEKAWAYPVVAGGRLYIRDMDTLWCYDVRE
jgi:outer membrane protein assembly factor BamB